MNTKCRNKKCKKKLVPSYCWSETKSGWGYMYCENKRCGVPSTERQGVAP